MSDKPALISGCYVDCKFMPGLKSARISIDIPIEHSNTFLQMFGAPDRANPVHVVVARLEAGAYAPEGQVAPGGVEKSASAATAEPAKDQDKPRTYTRSQKAALKCTDKDFQRWLIGKYDMLGLGVDELRADETLKRLLQITSKKELDTDGQKAAAWDSLLVDFELREMVR